MRENMGRAWVRDTRQVTLFVDEWERLRIIKNRLGEEHDDNMIGYLINTESQRMKIKDRSVQNA